MKRQSCLTAASLALGIALAFPSAARADPKAGIGLVAVGLAVAAPAAFVAVVGVGTVLMVRSIAETANRAPMRPARSAWRSTEGAYSPPAHFISRSAEAGASPF